MLAIRMQLFAMENWPYAVIIGILLAIIGVVSQGFAKILLFGAGIGLPILMVVIYLLSDLMISQSK